MTSNFTEQEIQEIISERDILRKVLSEKCDALVFKLLFGCEMRCEKLESENNRLRESLEERDRDYARALADAGKLMKERNEALLCVENERDALKSKLEQLRDAAEALVQDVIKLREAF